MVRILYIVALLSLFTWSSPLQSQVLDPSDTGQLDPDDPDYDASSARRGSPQQQRVILPDTFGIYLYQADNPNREITFTDSLLPGFQQYEPDRRVPFDYGTLGQLGSAAYRLRYEPDYRRGLEIGLRQFDLYRLDVDNMDFFRLQRPFTYLRYLRGSEQQDGMLETRFSRNFADGVNLVLGYDRIFQTGTQDQYAGMFVRNTNVTVGVSVRPVGSRYSGYFSYAANTFENRQNGGIADLTQRDIGEIDNPSVYRPYLDYVAIRHAYRQAAATQYLQFGAARDTLTGRERRAFTLKHQLRIERQFFRMTNIRNDVIDTSFYDLYPGLDLDYRGLRSVLTDNVISNEIGFSTFRRGQSAGRETVQRDLLELGLTHQYHRLGVESGDSSAHYVLATARVGVRPSDRLNLLIDGQLNLIGQVGDYRVAAEGVLDLGVAGKLEVSAVNQLYAPDLLQRTYRLNGAVYYDSDFGKTLELRVEGAYTLPFLGIRAGVAYNVLTNYIYRDIDGIPRQSDGPNSILQLTAERNFTFGNYRLDNRILLQEADQSVFRLPRLYGEHSLYYAGKWFGVLNVNLGADVRYVSGFAPQYYNPILQTFHLQNRTAVPFSVQVDPFFSLRVTRFRFFVKFIQAQTLINSDLFSLTADYPYPDGAVRLGVSWRLLD